MRTVDAHATYLPVSVVEDDHVNSHADAEDAEADADADADDDAYDSDADASHALHPKHQPLASDDAGTPQSPQPPPSRASWPYIYLLCIANFGISGAWALEFTTVTPFFEATLNAGDLVSHAVWIVGPLSGLIVAPIVGVLSDTCASPLGRRRPFIIGGMLATVVGLLTFSNAPQIAALIAAPATARHANIALAIAVAAFCLLDLAINTTMWPVRALQADLLPHHEQHRVQSASVVMGSLGDLAANALVDSFDQPVTHIRACYLLAALLYSCAVLVLLVVAREQPLPAATAAASDRAPPARSLNVVAYLSSLPGWMWRIGVPYGLGFFMLFCTMPNLSTWLGASVLGGNPNAARGSPPARAFERGVRAYGTASLVRAVAQIALSAAYPQLLRWVSPGRLMALCFGAFGALLAVASDTRSLRVAQLVAVALALPQAAHFTLPTALTVELADESNRGKYLGALNCFAVVPQLVDTMYTGWVSERFGESAVLKIGAVWGILTGICAFKYMTVGR